MLGDGYSRMYAIDIAQSVASRLKIAEESQTAIEKKRWRARARERERETSSAGQVLLDRCHKALRK